MRVDCGRNCAVDPATFGALNTGRFCAASHGKVLGLGVVEHDGRGRLLGVELIAVAEGEADAPGAEQLQNLFLVFQIGAGRIAEG